MPLSFKALARVQKAQRSPPVDREGPIHMAIFAYLQTALLPGSVIHHSPNELGVKLAPDHRRNILSMLKRKGMRGGWPDLEAVARQSSGPAVFFAVEVKSEDGTMQKNQTQLREEFEALGVPYCVARSITDVQKFLIENNIETRLALGTRRRATTK
jgi:hypothetical protein